MTVGYVLLKCELGAEEDVTGELDGMDEILWVDQTYGAYDLIAKIEAPNVEKLKEILAWKIQKMDKVRSTLSVNRKES